MLKKSKYSMGSSSIRMALRAKLKGKHLFVDHTGWYFCSTNGIKLRKDEIEALDLTLRLISTSRTTGRSTYEVR